jgi:hypothetical protein
MTRHHHNTTTHRRAFAAVAAFIIAAAAATAAAQAQVAAVITGPKEAEPGDLIILDATRSTGTAYHWELINSSKTFLPVENGTKAVFAAGQPGKYLFVLIVAGADNNQRLEIKIARHEVQIGRPPAPDPQPPRPPDPTPGPAPGPRLALIIHETAQATVERQAMFTALRTGDPAAYLKSKSHRLLILDQDTTDGQNAPILTAWRTELTRRNQKLPALIILPNGADFSPAAALAVGDLPPTAAAVLEAIKANGG